MEHQNCFVCNREIEVSENKYICENCNLQLIKKEEGIWDLPGNDEVSFEEEDHKTLFELENSSFWFKNRNKVITDTIHRFKPSGTIWDIGGGNGFVTKGLEESELPAILLEPSEIAVKNARKRGIDKIIQGSLLDLSVHDGSINAFGFFDVLEHFENPDKYLEAVSRKLSKSGFLYITVPAFKCLWSQIDDHTHHYARYTKSSLHKLVTPHGFERVYSNYFFSFLFAPAFILRSIPYILFKKKNKKELIENAVQQHKARNKTTLMDVLCDIERAYYNRLPLPFGTSLIAVYKKQ